MAVNQLIIKEMLKVKDIDKKEGAPEETRMMREEKISIEHAVTT